MTRHTLIPVLFAAVLALLASGCARSVDFTTSGRFELEAPHTVAILPIEWDGGTEGGEGEVAYLFRTMELEKVRTIDYHPVPLEEVDERYLKLGGKALRERGPKETARLLGADAVLYTTINEWDTDIFINYASLKLEATFELYSRSGEKLWEASHRIKDSDIRLDTKSMELAVLKAYEPKVQRFIDVVFSTLPPGTPPVREKHFFEWLP